MTNKYSPLPPLPQPANRYRLPVWGWVIISMLGLAVLFELGIIIGKNKQQKEAALQHTEQTAPANSRN